MIPLIDLLIKNVVSQGISHLRENPDKIRRYFTFASSHTLESMIRLITEYKIHVLNGYPREETQLPCIIVTIANEEEQPYGIGDGIDEEYMEIGSGEDNYLEWIGEEHSKYVQENVQMHSTLRLEVWADNSVTTSFLYAIVKYCLLASKWELLKQGLMLPNISGGDLEPVPEYFPIFVYRRSVMFDFEYVMTYPVGDLVIGKEKDHFPLGTKAENLNIEVKGIENGREKEEDIE